jgi:hypothetical protein
MRFCIALGCGKTHRDNNLRICSFPADQQRCDEWIEACGRTDFQGYCAKKLNQSSTYGLCELHFDDSQWANPLYKPSGLRPGAMPTIFNFQPDADGLVYKPMKRPYHRRDKNSSSDGVSDGDNLGNGDMPKRTKRPYRRKVPAVAATVGETSQISGPGEGSNHEAAAGDILPKPPKRPYRRRVIIPPAGCDSSSAGDAEQTSSQIAEGCDSEQLVNDTAVEHLEHIYHRTTPSDVADSATCSAVMEGVVGEASQRTKRRYRRRNATSTVAVPKPKKVISYTWPPNDGTVIPLVPQLDGLPQSQLIAAGGNQVTDTNVHVSPNSRKLHVVRLPTSDAAGSDAVADVDDNVSPSIGANITVMDDSGVGSNGTVQLAENGDITSGGAATNVTVVPIVLQLQYKLSKAIEQKQGLMYQLRAERNKTRRLEKRVASLMEELKLLKG